MGKYNDIEKMRAELEETIRLAELENKLNEGVEGYELHLSKDSKYRILVRIPYDTRTGFNEPSIEHMAEVLRNYPKTEDIVYDRRYNLPYVIHARRGYGDRYGTLSLSWISGEYEVRGSLKIDGSDFYEEFFKSIRHRQTTSSENATYTSIHEGGLIGKNIVPEYNFKAEQKCYYGGVRLLIDVDEAERLIEFIKKH